MERTGAREEFDKFMDEIRKFNREVRDDPEFRAYWKNRASIEPYDFTEELFKYSDNNSSTEDLKEDGSYFALYNETLLEQVQNLAGKIRACRDFVSDISSSLFSTPLKDLAEQDSSSVQHSLKFCNSVMDETLSALHDIRNDIKYYED